MTCNFERSTISNSFHRDARSLSSSNMFTNVPMCGRTSTANSSPAFKNLLVPIPTPAGVPVTIVVPGRQELFRERGS